MHPPPPSPAGEQSQQQTVDDEISHVGTVVMMMEDELDVISDGGEALQPDELHPQQKSPQHILLLLSNGTDTEIIVNDTDDAAKGEVEEEAVDENDDKTNKHHFTNGPTPLHKNQGFFKEDDGVASKESSSPTAKQHEVRSVYSDTEKQQSSNTKPLSPTDSLDVHTNNNNDATQNNDESLASSPKVKRKRASNRATIEEDASIAFSHYKPMPPLSSLMENTFVANNHDDDVIHKAQITIGSKKKKKKRKWRTRRDKRDHKKDKAKSEGIELDGSTIIIANDLHSQANTQQPSSSSTPTQENIIPSSSSHHDPLHSIILQDNNHHNNNSHNNNDPILSKYLPQLNFLNEQYYTKIKPYRMGNRNLPPNQIEVILRRRAVCKRSSTVDVNKSNLQATTTAIMDAKLKVPPQTTAPPTKVSSSHNRPPLVYKNTTPPRRKLFPTMQQQQQHHGSSSPTLPSTRKGAAYYDDDDSTISSTTIASQLTSSQQQQQPPTLQQHEQQTSLLLPLPTTTAQVVQPQHHYTGGYHAAPPATAIAISTTLLPTEEIIGDTSLGLKLTILQGKVILQSITPLDDGRASPAQLCGVGGSNDGRSRGGGSLLSPGDIIIAVNGKSLINGSIHNPVGMDKIISVLRPLSKPIMNEATKEYSREVRLRLVLGEGKLLLMEQREREKRRVEDMEQRKKLGLERGTSGGSLGRDPAADLFGIGAFMAVDQHSGMPMFGHMHYNDSRHGDEKEKEELPTVVAEETLSIQVAAAKKQQSISSLTGAASYRSRQSVQSQIAHQIHLDHEYQRQRNASSFFTLNKSAPVLLRPPSPPPPDPSTEWHHPEVNAIDFRKQKLERGSQTMNEAKGLVEIVESYDRGIDPYAIDEDPLEVASRACGTASVRTGASKRRWHRGGSDNASAVIAEEPSVSNVSNASSTENAHPNFDVSTIRSGESGAIEGCDHRQLVELAANNDNWKHNVIKRLEGYAQEMLEKDSLHRGSSEGEQQQQDQSNAFDSFLFGNEVASILGKKKQSLALPPGEMTAMLYDLVELLKGGLPDQIFMGGGPEKQSIVSFANNAGANGGEKHADVSDATDFLLSALKIWLKSFKPLPWKQRRALWPTSQQQFGESDGNSTFMSSRMDDNDTLSLMSGTTATTAQKEKRNLRELIEDMELDGETRRETCRLATFYFTHRFSKNTCNGRLSQEEEEEASALIGAYGSYLDIYKCLVCAGKLHSKVIVDKVVGVAKYDSQHKEAVKALQKAKVLLFYEPNMLSALLELLPSISAGTYSSNLDFNALLVSAYPDLQPWCVQETSPSSESERGDSDEFYLQYLSSLLHYEEGNDAAKRDRELVKEWCQMLCSPDDADPAMLDKHHGSFFHIASRDDPDSHLYHRDLPFLMDISVKMSEFGLTLSLAKEIISNKRYCQREQALADVLQHLTIVTEKAVEGNEGEINTVLLGQAIEFFNVIPSCIEGEGTFGFDNVTELSKLLEKCYLTSKQDPTNYSNNNIHACITTISENAPPAHSLQVFSQWEHTSVQSLVSAIHTSLIRGAREGFRNEISGSLLRIQRAREEGRRPIVENDMMRWNPSSEELLLDENNNEEEEVFIWDSILDGTLEIEK